MHAHAAVEALTWHTARMRLALAALALVLGCHHESTTTTPANKVPAPDYSKTADDVLGFLPADADMVFGVDMVQLRQSPLWAKYEPHLVAFAKEGFEKMGGWCGQDPAVAVKKLERVTAGFKIVGNRVKGVAVMRGFDPAPLLDCTVTDTQKHGGTATRDRGIVVATYPQNPGTQIAFGGAGPTTLVVQFDEAVSHDGLTAVLAGGTPLRGSQTFLTLYNRREPGAAAWGMANGNAKMFDELAQMGMRPKSIDGTLIVTDAFTIAVRMTMATPDDAKRLTAELDKVKGGASAFLQRFDYTVNGPMIQINVVMTEAQAQNILGMLGGMGGP